MKLPMSSDAHNAPRDRKNEYIVMVSMKMNSRLMKNWEGVRARFAMLRWGINDVSVKGIRLIVQVYYHVKEHNLDKHQRNIHDNLRQGIR